MIACDDAELLQREERMLSSRYHRALFGQVRQAVAGSGRILDAGCGYGAHARRLAAMGAEVTGVDLRSTFVDPGGERFTACSADVARLPFRDGAFDGVYSLDLIEHVRDDLATVAEIHRVLRPGGWALLETPNVSRLSVRLRRLAGKRMPFPRVYGEDPILGLIYHDREYTADELVALMSSAGFRDIEVRGLWLGLTQPELGLPRVPRRFRDVAQSFVVVGRKAPAATRREDLAPSEPTA